MTPGQGQFAQQEIRRALRALNTAERILESRAFEDAISRIYYATFHAARAALAVRDLFSRTHSGQIKMFQETFGAAPSLTQIFQQRVAADYGLTPYEPVANDVQRWLDDARAFVERCRGIVEAATEAGATEPDPPPDL